MPEVASLQLNVTVTFVLFLNRWEIAVHPNNFCRNRAALLNGLPGVAPLSKGERVMLDRKRLDTFYRELQTPSRIEANTPRPQTEEAEEDLKSQLTQS
jgi:hypothetical protein